MLFYHSLIGADLAPVQKTESRSAVQSIETLRENLHFKSNEIKEIEQELLESKNRLAKAQRELDITTKLVAQNEADANQLKAVNHSIYLAERRVKNENKRLERKTESYNELKQQMAKLETGRLAKSPLESAEKVTTKSIGPENITPSEQSNSPNTRLPVSPTATVEAKPENPLNNKITEIMQDQTANKNPTTPSLVPAAVQKDEKNVSLPSAAVKKPALAAQKTAAHAQKTQSKIQLPSPTTAPNSNRKTPESAQPTAKLPVTENLVTPVKNKPLDKSAQAQSPDLVKKSIEQKPGNTQTLPDKITPMVKTKEKLVNTSETQANVKSINLPLKVTEAETKEVLDKDNSSAMKEPRRSSKH